MTQFVSPDDEHDVLETRRELKININTQKRIVRHVGHLPRIVARNVSFQSRILEVPISNVGWKRPLMVLVFLSLSVLIS